MRIFGLILAGGEGRRLGGRDKAMVELAGETLLARSAARLGPQVERLALSTNGSAERFPDFPGPVLADATTDRLGPMAGLLAGLNWLAEIGGTHLASAAVDLPFLPCDLVPHLLLAGEAADGFAVAESNGRVHPTCGLWPLRLRDPLRAALASGERRIGQWAEAQGAARASFDDRPADPFLNINTPEDLADAEALIAASEPQPSRTSPSPDPEA